MMVLDEMNEIIMLPSFRKSQGTVEVRVRSHAAHIKPCVPPAEPPAAHLHCHRTVGLTCAAAVRLAGVYMAERARALDGEGAGPKIFARLRRASWKSRPAARRAAESAALGVLFAMRGMPDAGSTGVGGGHFFFIA